MSTPEQTPGVAVNVGAQLPCVNIMLPGLYADEVQVTIDDDGDLVLAEIVPPVAPPPITATPAEAAAHMAAQPVAMTVGLGGEAILHLYKFLRSHLYATGQLTASDATEHEAACVLRDELSESD